MKRRILYPGEIESGDIILITGSLYGTNLSFAASSLAEGIRLRGLSCTTCCPGVARTFSQSEQNGSYLDFDDSFDVMIVDMGQYLGGARFRQGPMLPLEFSRCVFFTPAADPAVSFSEPMEWEVDRRRLIQTHLTRKLGMPVHLAAPSLIRPSGSEQMLQETANEAISYLEAGRPIPEELKERREIWRGQAGIDRVPQLEMALW
ncbi:MAG: hypothetical protein AWU57_443 [Marinobacter sp. T13-3]|nr:MAG: hypothetical protein AWU57_443 [Marinobacter sp. T13-3]